MIDPLAEPWLSITPYVIFAVIALCCIAMGWSVLRVVHDWIFPPVRRHDVTRMRQDLEVDTGVLMPSRPMRGHCGDGDGDGGDD